MFLLNLDSLNDFDEYERDEPKLNREPVDMTMEQSKRSTYSSTRTDLSGEWKVEELRKQAVQEVVAYASTGGRLPKSREDYYRAKFAEIAQDYPEITYATHIKRDDDNVSKPPKRNKKFVFKQKRRSYKSQDD